MYLLYLDDSGSIANANEEYFVLGGVCVPEVSVYWLTKQLDELALELNPNEPDRVEFHAADIFSGRREPWNSLNKEIRIQTIKKVLNLLQYANDDIVLFACAVHKASFKGKNAINLAFEDLCNRFDMYLSRVYRETEKPQKGMIIFDRSSYENTIQQLSLEFRRTGTRWRSLNNIIEVPFFVDSRASRIIQLADHIAYAVFRRYNAADLNYFNCIENRFDRYQGVIHGLAHKQFNNLNCTCPACLTRNIANRNI